MSSQNFKVFWDEVIKQIHSEFISSNNPGDFEIWFGRIKYVEDNGTEITVSFPSDFMFNFMNSNGYILKIQTKFKDICGQDISIKPNYEKEIPNTENNLNKKVIPNNNPEEILEEVSTNLSKTENPINSCLNKKAGLLNTDRLLFLFYCFCCHNIDACTQNVFDEYRSDFNGCL